LPWPRRAANGRGERRAINHRAAQRDDVEAHRARACAARAPTRAQGGSGADLVDAYASGPTAIDCGSGQGTVRIGFSRHVRTVSCERVSRRYR
jgi:4-aminobutyrate aminotransferase-like enzyme